jgi:hypothetical protein
MVCAHERGACLLLEIRWQKGSLADKMWTYMHQLSDHLFSRSIFFLHVRDPYHPQIICLVPRPLIQQMLDQTTETKREIFGSIPPTDTMLRPTPLYCVDPAWDHGFEMLNSPPLVR